MSVEIGLAFNLVRCESCGEARPAQPPCPHCGSATVYPDPELDRRRAIVARIRPVLDSGATGRSRSLAEVFTEVGDWSDRFLQAIQAVGTSADDASERQLRTELERFHELASGVAASPRGADQRAAWAALDSCLAILRGAADAYLDALEALSPESAARYGTQGQRSLDAAAAVMRSFNLASSGARRGGRFFRWLRGAH